MGWKVGGGQFGRDLQASSPTQFWCFLATLPKNYKSNEDIDLIFGFSLTNRIIYSIPRIFPYNWGGEFDLKMEIPVLIFPENC